MNITAEDYKDYLKQVVNVIEEEKDYLCELDRKLGDGDHGVTMSIGWQAIKEDLNEKLAEEKDCSKISSTIGMTFLNAVGSSVGPLYATGFIKGAQSVKGKEKLNDKDLANYWIAFGDGIKERSQAEVGDKTIIDTLEPMIKVLKDQFRSTGNFLESFKEAVHAAEKGMKSTEHMISKIGRSSRLGERSIGVQDPGATSAYIIIATFLTFITNKK